MIKLLVRTDALRSSLSRQQRTVAAATPGCDAERTPPAPPDESVCRKECEANVAAAPGSNFFFWARVNSLTHLTEEGFHWLHAYGVEQNDCSVLMEKMQVPPPGSANKTERAASKLFFS